MRILAFDTATAATTVALGDIFPASEGRETAAEGGVPAAEGGERVEVGWTAELRDDPVAGERPQHAARLLALIAEIMEASGTGWEGIDRIAVGVGPGTFTGLRIGVATANALGRATGIPLVGVSTLESLARRALLAAREPEAVVAVLDARRREVFAAAWDGHSGAPVMSPRALAPDALAESICDLATPMAIGDGAVAYRGVLEASGVYVPEDVSELHRVTAASHLLIAPGLQVVDPDALVPDYQRLPDARPRVTSGART